LDAQDARLARAFADRDASAYEAAYRRYAGKLYGAAFTILRQPEEAADCVHDVFMRLWKRGDDFRVERGSLAAFLAVCVRNEALSRRRTREFRRRIDETLNGRDEPDLADAAAGRVSVESALSRLGDVQRQSVELAYYGGLTHVQIARRLNEPVGTIKSRLSSALRRLRDAFAEAERAG
jgi:RNA polymerase sigma-70 factor (ECF subfamily)